MLRRPLEKFDRLGGARTLLLLMKITGIWQWRKRTDPSLLARILQNIHHYGVHLPASFVFCILMWIEALKSTDLVQAGGILYMSLAVVIYNVKLINVWCMYSKCWNFINDLEFNPIFELHTEKEKEMWMSHQKKFFILFMSFLSVSVLTLVITYFTVLFADDYELGYPYYVPFDWRNPRNYWFAFAIGVFGMVVSCLSNVCVDFFGCYTIFHIGLLYKLLSYRIEQLQTAGGIEAMEKLMQCLQLHRNIKRATQECEVIVSFHALAEIIFSALIICFCGFRIQKMNILENLWPFFGMVQFIALMVLEIYMPCYFANEITVNSSMLLFNIYSMNWLEFPVMKRKFLILYMEFMKHPVRLRAGNFFEIGLPIFTKVMNNAYSFFALLLKVDN